jgi:prolipoprotein diacylglyceryltransferase
MRAILFHLPFGLPLYAYGTMLCLSVVVGRIMTLRFAARDGLDPKLMDRACLWALLGALAGTRLLYVVTNLDQFERITDIFLFWRGGLVAYGGFLGGFASTVVFCRSSRQPVDLGRLRYRRCVSDSCSHASAVFWPAAIFGYPLTGRGPPFPAGSPAFREQTFRAVAGRRDASPRHPTQPTSHGRGRPPVLVLAVRRRRTSRGSRRPRSAYAVLRYLIEVFRPTSTAVVDRSRHPRLRGHVHPGSRPPTCYAGPHPALPCGRGSSDNHRHRRTERLARALSLIASPKAKVICCYATLERA